MFIEMTVVDNGDGEPADQIVNFANVIRMGKENGGTNTTLYFIDGTEDVFAGSMAKTMQKIRKAKLTN